MSKIKIFIYSVSSAFALMFSLNCAGQNWQYEVKKGDTLWNIADEYLIDVSYYKRVQKLNKVKNPLLLQVGRLIEVPVSWLGSLPGMAKVVSKSGNVNIIHGNQKQTRVSLNYFIKPNDEILTHDDGLVSIVFSDNSTLTINPNTHLVFKTLNQSSDGKVIRTNIAINKGRVEVNVKPQQFSRPRFIIQTPAAVTAVRGTLFRVSVDESTADTVTEVLSGAVEVIGNNESLLLTDGYSNQTKVGTSPGAALKLLSGPKINPPGLFDVQLGHLDWARMKEAGYYRVRIATDEEFVNVIYDNVVVSNQVDDIYFLKNGRHYASVRAANEFKMEGLDSVIPVEVKVYPIPPVIISPPNLSAIKKTKPDFIWNIHSSDVKQVQFQLSIDKQFNDLIVDEILTRSNKFELDQTLGKGNYYWRIASINQQGRGSFSTAAQLTIK